MAVSDRLVPGETENLSSSYHAEGDAARPHDTIDRDTDQGDEGQRGRRAGFDPKSGEVHGSGSNAGGNGTPGEDYDNDPQGGGGREPTQTPRH